MSFEWASYREYGFAPWESDPPEVKEWWNALPDEDAMAVAGWILSGPIPEEWEASDVAYAYTECPVGLFSRRYGRLL